MISSRLSEAGLLEQPVSQAYRGLFPITREWTYLQNASIGPLSTRVLDAVQRCVAEQAAAGTESYASWLEAAESIRRRAAALLNAPADCVSFVRNTAEGLSRLAFGLPWAPGDNIITAAIEYPTNVMPWRALERAGVETRIVPARDGRVAIDDLVRAVDARTRMVAISSIQFSSGFRIDLARLGSFCRERDILLSVDAIHTLGVFPLDVRATPVDFVSAGGHKWLLSPVGTGLFYVRPELLDRLRVIEVGAAGDARYHVQDELLLQDFVPRSSAKRFEGGVVPFALLAGMGAAIDLALEIGVDRIARHALMLADRTAAGLTAAGCRILSPRSTEEEKSAIVVFVHPSVSSESLKRALTAERISVSLRTIGGHAVLRASPHFYNDASDIDRLVDAVARASKGAGR
jgi:selenocysteine lyase/cysteine desulfurase